MACRFRFGRTAVVYVPVSRAGPVGIDEAFEFDCDVRDRAARFAAEAARAYGGNVGADLHGWRAGVVWLGEDAVGGSCCAFAVQVARGFVLRFDESAVEFSRVLCSPRFAWLAVTVVVGACEQVFGGADEVQEPEDGGGAKPSLLRVPRPWQLIPAGARSP